MFVDLRLALESDRSVLLSAVFLRSFGRQSESHQEQKAGMYESFVPSTPAAAVEVRGMSADIRSSPFRTEIAARRAMH